MPQLNHRATTLTANALYYAADIYEKLSENSELPQRLRAQFSAQRHTASILAQLFEEQSITAPHALREEYVALIWEE